MHQSPKCGLFPTVDKRHLQEGISQEQKKSDRVKELLEKRKQREQQTKQGI